MEGDKYRQIGTSETGIPIYKEINPMTYSKPESDALSLMVEMVRELRKENEQLKADLFIRKPFPRESTLANQISDIENGKVIQR